MELRCLTVSDPAHLARARRVALRMAAAALTTWERDDLALVVSELGSNILAHGGGGEILLGVEATGVEVLALDWGPGMPDVKISMSDGVTTRAGIGGIGLGAVLRQSVDVDLWSQPGLGSVVRARLGRRAGPVCFSLAARHRDSCGDTILAEETPWGHRVVAVDMAGQGADTAAISSELAEQVRGRWRVPPGRHLSQMDEQLKRQRLHASAVVLDLHREGRVVVAGTSDHALWIDGAPCALPQGSVGIAVDPGELELDWRATVALCSDGVADVPVSGSPALRAARALWGASGRDDLSVGVFSREETR